MDGSKCDRLPGADVIDFVWYNGRWVSKMGGKAMKDEAMDMLLGYTPAQWCTVLKMYPPEDASLRSMARSRHMWQVNNKNDPKGVDPKSKASYHMGKFILKMMNQVNARSA